MHEKLDSALGLITCIIIHVTFYFLPKYSNNNTLRYLPVILWAIIFSIITTITVTNDHFELHPAITPVCLELSIKIVLLCVNYFTTLMISFAAFLIYLMLASFKFGILKPQIYECISGAMMYIYIFSKVYFMNRD